LNARIGKYVIHVAAEIAKVGTVPLSDIGLLPQSSDCLTLDVKVVGADMLPHANQRHVVDPAIKLQLQFCSETFVQTQVLPNTRFPPW
jgi:hypothetical protein